jgi:50S ribosomal subunit-associated GTPase HflX
MPPVDQVFATLDPTVREVKLRRGRRIILSRTVGFMSDLPTMLIPYLGSAMRPSNRIALVASSTM